MQAIDKVIEKLASIGNGLTITICTESSSYNGTVRTNFSVALRPTISELSLKTIFAPVIKIKKREIEICQIEIEIEIVLKEDQ